MAWTSKIPDPAGVARAFQMASHLPGDEQVRLRVNVLSSEGVMLAGGILSGFEQAAFLRDQLQILGAFECLPAHVARACGCDILLREGAAPLPLSAELLREAPRLAARPAAVSGGGARAPRHARRRGESASG